MFEYGSYGYIAQKEIKKAENFVNLDADAAILYAQQACEKILKHWITQNCNDDIKESLLKSHKLKKIADAMQIDGLQNYGDCLQMLSSYYYDGRYPGIDFEEPTLKDAQLLVKGALEIYNIVIKDIEEKNNHEKNTDES